MLFVTRRAGQAVKIGPDIAVSVVEIRSGQVRLSIQAPRSIPVYREEIAERIEAERSIDAIDTETNWNRSPS